MLKRRHGFTTLEIILVVALLSLLIAAVAPFFRTTIAGWELKDRQLEVLQTQRVGMDKMIRDLKSAVEFETANPTEVEFKDADENTIEYKLDGSVLERDGKSLVESVDRLSFTYYDIEGNVTTNADDVYSLKIAMTVSDTEDKVSPSILTSWVVMRKDPTFYKLVINEINYNPPDFPQGRRGTVAEKKVEWVEIYNYGTTQIDLDGWTIQDTNDTDQIKKDNGTFIIGAGEYGLIAAKSHEVDDHYSVDEDAVRFKLNDQKIGNQLDDGGDTITIKDADGTSVDSVTYGNWATQGNTIERIDPEADSSQQSNWQASNLVGSYTPGSANTVTP